MKAHKAKQLSQSKPIYTELEQILQFIEAAAKAGNTVIYTQVDTYELNELADLGYNYYFHCDPSIYAIWWD